MKIINKFKLNILYTVLLLFIIIFSEITDSKYLSNSTIISIVLFLSLIMILYNFIINKSLIISLKKLIKNTDDIASGIVPNKIESFKNDEIGELSKKFNSITDKLQDSYNILQEEINIRIEKEKDLIASEKRYRSLFEKNFAVMLLIDPETGDIIDANDSAIKFYGFTRDELLNESIFNISIDTNDEFIDKMRNVNYKKDNHYFDRHQLSFGEIKDVEIFNSTIEIENKTFINSIIIDITEKTIMENNLKKSEHNYRMLFNNVNDAVFVYQFDENRNPTNFIEINNVACESLDYTRDELLNLNINNIREINSHEEITSYYDELFEKNHVMTTVNHLTKDGNKIPIEINATLFNMDHKKTVLTIARDITERKNAEMKIFESLKEKDLLIKEIHHRVKNNLQIILSLLNLQLRNINTDETKEILQINQDRVKSMALIHENLYQANNFSKIDFKNYLKYLVIYLMQTYKKTSDTINLKLTSENIFLKIDTAIPLGLIINELISNSLKHSFANKKTGEIIIEFINIKNNFYKIRIVDDGIKFPEDLKIDNASTFGFNLVNNLIHQINGKIDLNNKNHNEIIIQFEDQ